MFKYILIIPIILFLYFILSAFGINDLFSLGIIATLIVLYIIVALISHFLFRGKKDK